MATPRKTRGEYRPIYEALIDGKDYRRLEPAAKLCLTTLKIKSGVAGIKPWPALTGQLSERTGHTDAHCKRAVKTLIAEEWIQHEDGIVWVIRGLMFEPQMTPGNPNHRAHIQDLIAGLPTSPIVDRFRAYYADYFPGIPQGNADGITKGIGNGIGNTLPNPTTTTTTTPPHPLPVSTPTSTSNGDRPTTDDKLLLTKAANAGLDVKYPHRNPLIASSGHAHEAATAICEAGVDIDFAAAVIYAYASTMTKAEPPGSLKYFTRHVIDRWHQEQAKRDAATYNPATVTPVPEVDQFTAFAIRYAREGDAYWQATCEERGIAWKAVA